MGVIDLPVRNLNRISNHSQEINNKTMHRSTERKTLLYMFIDMFNMLLFCLLDMWMEEKMLWFTALHVLAVMMTSRCSPSSGGMNGITEVSSYQPTDHYTNWRVNNSYSTNVYEKFCNNFFIKKIVSISCLELMRGKLARILRWTQMWHHSFI